MTRMDFPSREELLNLHGEFTWDFGRTFFIEVKGFACNFVWSAPGYNGTNEIKPFTGSYQNWLSGTGLDFGRSKGYRRIGDYCGEDVVYNPGPSE